jgi:alpha-2-macroglobulin
MAGEIGKSEWLSTQTAGWCLYAISRYFGTNKEQSGIQAKVTIDGHAEKVQSGLAVVRLPLTIGNNGKIAAAVENTGTGDLYARLVAKGIPLEDTLSGVQNNLKVEAVFTDRDGQPLNPASLPQGTDLFLNVTVSHPGIRGKYQDLAMSTLFPSGWEILNSRIQDIPENQKVSFNYQDLRDDRVYTYFDLLTGETKRFRIALHAAYGGKFFLPAIVVEGMYDNSIYARIPGQWVTVIHNN